jgi:hypothetical protein
VKALGTSSESLYVVTAATMNSSHAEFSRGFAYCILKDLGLVLAANFYTLITIFVNLGLFQHFETVTNIGTWIKSHRYWRML